MAGELKIDSWVPEMKEYVNHDIAWLRTNPVCVRCGVPADLDLWRLQRAGVPLCRSCFEQWWKARYAERY